MKINIDVKTGEHYLPIAPIALSGRPLSRQNMEIYSDLESGCRCRRALS